MKNTATTVTLSLFAGSLVPTIAIYVLGGSSASILSLGLVLGLSLVVVPIMIDMKGAARLLWAVAHAWEDGRSGLRRHGKTAPKELSRRPVERVPDPIEGDVVSALVNMGVAIRKAQSLVTDVAGNQKFESFEELFRASIEAGKSGGVLHVPVVVKDRDKVVADLEKGSRVVVGAGAGAGAGAGGSL